MVNSFKNEKGEKRGNNNEKISIAIVSAACCMPSMSAFDEQARAVIDRAVSETGVNAEVALIPATTAMSAFPKITAEAMAQYSEGKIALPVILINGKIVSSGVPQLESIKAALKNNGK